jgi:hypothetical protein
MPHIAYWIHKFAELHKTPTNKNRCVRKYHRLKRVADSAEVCTLGHSQYILVAGSSISEQQTHECQIMSHFTALLK